MLIMCRILWNDPQNPGWERGQVVGFYAVPRVGDHIQWQNLKFEVLEVVHHADTSPPDLHVALAP